MDFFVFVAVLAAAALHASWNTLAKGSSDRFVSTMLVAAGFGTLGLPLLFFVPLPAAHSWPWLIASGLIHIGYFLFLARAFQTGDLVQVYPIARGTAPLLVALLGGGVLSERLTGTMMLGLGLLVPGLWLMAFRGGAELSRLSLRPILAALLTATFTALYTVVDGIGVRTSGNAAGYIAWVHVVIGAFVVAAVAVLRGRETLAAMARSWRIGLGGGLMAMLAYGIALWAMTKAPVTLVAALRETSVLFVALLSALLLKERLTSWRIVAMLLIVAGVAMLRLG